MRRICIILFLYNNVSFAQINESDTIKFQLRSSLTGAYQQGNVEILTIRSKLDFSFSPQKDWVFKSQNSSLYQSFYSKKADNDIFSRNYFYYKPQQKIYPFAIAYISSNFRRKIDVRYFTGAGATYQLINTKKNVLKLSVSAVYEATKFNATTYNYSYYNSAKKIDLWRGTLYIGGWYYLLDNHIRVYYDAFWQSAFNNKINHRTQFDVGFDFQIWKGLSFNAVYVYTHENVVVSNVLQDDKILTFGLSYNFKKK
jgi:Protein of unknown function, DUF481